jgi:hypothetical protein
VTSLFLHGFAAGDHARKKANGSVKVTAKKG